MAEGVSEDVAAAECNEGPGDGGAVEGIEDLAAGGEGGGCAGVEARGLGSGWVDNHA